MSRRSSHEENGVQRFGVEENGSHQGKKGFFGDKGSNKTTMKIFGIIAAVAILVLVIVLPVYFTVIEPNEDKTEVVADSDKFNCYPEGGVDKEMCEDRGCTWDLSESAGVPSCYYAGEAAYSLEGEVDKTSKGITSRLKLSEKAPSPFGVQYSQVQLTTSYISSSALRIKIAPVDVERYEVPTDHKESIDLPNDALYDAQHGVGSNGRFGVQIKRKSTERLLFDTSVGQLMLADQFLQLSTRVASEYIYGFGEHMHETFKHDMNWKRHGMFTRDKGVEVDYNLYGMHPYFMCMEGDGNAYGVFFVNSNAMEVDLQPMPAITFRTIGGILDFYIFLGPSPEQVTAQYTEVIGRPYFPPYWSFGFQLCRWGYGSLDNLDEVVNRTLESGIPYDVQYSDIDYMERQMDFTIDNETYYGLEDYVRQLKADNDMKYIIILDPAITGNETEGSYPPFDHGVRDNVFIKTFSGEIAWGKVWPDLPGIEVDTSMPGEYQTEHYRAYTAFPDFFLPNTSTWWKNLTVVFHDRIEYDGLWIDMNEPTSFVDGSPDGCLASKYDSPPYIPKVTDGTIYDDTICMQNAHYNPKTGKFTEHYNLHSMYGWSQTQSTLDACREATGKRCLVISRSTFPGAGKNAGHWLGDNTSNWKHLAASIIGMFEFNLFGFPYVGADVCGFFEDSNKDLCRRWMQIGAFYPFYRNHNHQDTVEQDPAVYGADFIDDVKETMFIRYRLLPYLYTLFYDAYTIGSTVVRPLMNEFPTDVKTYTTDTQFLWGSGLLITPVVTEDAVKVNGYFPEARWFDYYTGVELDKNGDVELDAPLDFINLHLRGGVIIPTQAANRTTSQSRKNPFGLIVSLDESEEATGKMFWDDGDSIDTIEEKKYTILTFTCKENTLKIEIQQAAPAELDLSSLYFDKIDVYGLKTDVSSVTVDGSSGEGSGAGSADGMEYDPEKKTLKITQLRLDLTSKHDIAWA